MDKTLGNCGNILISAVDAVRSVGRAEKHRLIESSIKPNGKRIKRDAEVEATIPDARRSAR